MSPSPLGSSAFGADEPGGQVELADLLAEITRAVPGVADLHGGVFGEVATYLPGRQVAGVRIEDDHVEIHVSVLWNEPVRATAEQVSARVAEVVGRPVYVTVDDVVHPSFPSRDASGPSPTDGAEPDVASSSPKPVERPDTSNRTGLGKLDGLIAADDSPAGTTDTNETRGSFSTPDIPSISRSSKEFPS